ncbi:hypothetical protein BKA61DRAFT_718020 [Leptodontidium sp. MPI-SDFR-AT-0119]|nr:hypothetical protein BKA61DRAFT_718020 [Leptodontidium sp. MPI-SDFR-AT-0119]
MPLIDRLGLRRRQSRNGTSDDSSDSECDLDVFNPFEQFDIGITPDGKPTSSFSSMSAYTVVDSPRLTMDDFLKGAPDATGDGRLLEAHYAVTFDSTSRPQRPDNRITSSSDPELRRVAATNSLHKLYKTQEAAAMDRGKVKAPQKGLEAISRSQSFSDPQREPSPRSQYPLRQEAPEVRWTKAMTLSNARNEETRTYKEDHEYDARGDDTSLPLQPHEPEANPTSHVLSFQRIAGYKFELGDDPATGSNCRRRQLMGIPHRSSRGIRPHIPARVLDKFTPMKTTDVHDPFKKHVELEFKRRTSDKVATFITKGDPKRKKEEMTNAAIKRWAFWGALNRAGQDSKRDPKADVGTETSGNESEHSIGVDRTEAYRSIEGADQAARARILNGHVEQVVEAARVQFKDAGARKRVNVVGNEAGKRHSRFVNIESARHEVVIPASIPQVNTEDVSTNERRQPEGIFQGLMRWSRRK